MNAIFADTHHNHRLQLAYEPIETIKPNPRDPRIYSAAETRRVAKSLTTFGAMPLIVTSERVVLSGNIWLEASKLAGITQLPVVVADHLTPAQAEAFMVAQVRLVERGEWDERMLGEILRDLTLQDLDFDLEITGFDVPQIDLYIEKLDQPEEGPDPADELPPAGPAVTQAGDLWLLGPHRILCGDSLAPESYQRLMAGELAAIVFTDPPYNVPIAGNVSGKGVVKHGDFAMACGEMTEAQFTAFLGQAMGLAAEHAAEGSLAYWCMDWRHMHELTVAGRQAYKSLINLCVWTKPSGGQGSLYRSQHELVFVFKKGHAPHRNNVHLGKFGRNRTNVWSYPGVNTFGRGGEEGDLLAMHPTVKPVALIADALLDASVRGDLVLDPFCGSGSTVIAAEKVGRRAYAIEIAPAYVDTAIRRWERWSGEEARLSGTEQTFSQIAASRTQELTHA
jgi:16S rRNA G966 N2-methylase RsmD